jgi:hypothetical protein
MSANLNAELNLNQFALKIIESAYGLEFTCVIIFLIVVVASIYFIAKSGVITGLREFSEHRRRKRNEQINEQENLLVGDTLLEFSDELQYHLKVSKLSNYLNIKNKDIDLLKYILSCRDKDKAVRLYKIGEEYLEKDKESNNYKLKTKYTLKRIKWYGYWGTILYILINIFGSTPYLVVTYLRFAYREDGFTASNDLNYLMFFFFMIFFLISMFVLWYYLRPEAAKNFLEMEKINNNA